MLRRVLRVCLLCMCVCMHVCKLCRYVWYPSLGDVRMISMYVLHVCILSALCTYVMCACYVCLHVLYACNVLRLVYLIGSPQQITLVGDGSKFELKALMRRSFYEKHAALILAPK